MNPLGQVPEPDSIRTVLREIFAAQEYDWQTARNPLAFLVEAWHRLLRWLADLQDGHPGAYVVLLVGLSVLLVVILAHFGYLIWRALRPGTTGPTAAARQVAETMDARWYRAQSDRLAAEGQFAEALAHRFMGVLLDLDARAIVTFHPSKTPAEYLRESGLSEEQRSALRDLVHTLYRHLFAGQACGAPQLGQFDLTAARLGSPIAAG